MWDDNRAFYTTALADTENSIAVLNPVDITLDIAVDVKSSCEFDITLYPGLGTDEAPDRRR